jgi:CubicO group peptidase (beta-lactamase class C family)
MEQRDAGFRQMDTIYDTRTVSAGSRIHAFARGIPLTIGVDIPKYMKAQRVSGLIVVHRNKIRIEKYALGYGRSGHWEGFSIAKSITSTLLGAAIKDGYIRDLSDSVTVYIPRLKGSAYDTVSIHQLLTMTSGVRWNEDYLNPESDAVRMRFHRPPPGIDATVSYMFQLPRNSSPGSSWAYNTGEANLVGVLVSQATGKSLGSYLAEKIWKPYGMEQSAKWELDDSQSEMGGCCLSASLRDYARFGQFILGGGKIGGRHILPASWISLATSKQVDIGSPGRGYGYQWWTNDDGSFQATGIFGQCIFIDPKRQLVIAINANWPTATDAALARDRSAFFKAVQTSIDAGK